MMGAIRLALLSGASLLALAGPSHAEPISLGIAFALFSGPLGAVFSFSAIVTGVNAALVAGAVIGGQLLTGRQGKIQPQEYKSTFEESPNQSEIRAVGRVRLGGLKIFGNTKGFDRWRIIGHCKGPWSQTEAYYLNGIEVTVEDGGDVSSPPWAYNGGTNVSIGQQLGTGSETLWTAINAAFPDQWTPDHLAKGIFQSAIKYFSPGQSEPRFLKLFQNGAPELEVEGRAEPVYDPRESGQVATTASTWEWSDNGILVATHMLRAFPQVAAADIDYDTIETQADLAEVSTATLTGTEVRARAWGLWESERARGDTMQQMLDSIGAEIVETDGGLFVIRLINDAPTAEIDFDANDIVELRWVSGPESVERPNVCRVKYYSPERNYEMTEIDMSSVSWARYQTEIDRVGEQIFDVELPFCPSASQAQRIARLRFELARADAGTVMLNFSGLASWGLSYANIELPEIDETILVKLGSGRVNDKDGMIEFPFVVWPTLAAWNPATMEAPAPSTLPQVQYPSELDTPVVPSELIIVDLPSSAKEIRGAFTAVTDATIAEATFRKYTAGLPGAWRSMTETGLAYAYANAVEIVAAGDDVDLRVRFFNDDGEGSYFSPYKQARPLAYDNTACGAPTLDVEISGTGTYTVAGTVEVSELRAATVLIEVKQNTIGTYSTVTTLTVRPGVTYDFDPGSPYSSGPSPISYTVRATTYTSDGTAGTPATAGFTIPET